MTPTLRDDQKAGVEWAQKGLKKYKGVLLADRRGLGKTAQALQVAREAGGPVLIIAPAYLVYNWLDELDLWAMQGTRCVIDSTKQVITPGVDIYLCSYNMAASKGVFEQLFKMKFSLIICDEAHTFRTWNSIRSRRIMGTCQNKKSNLKMRAENMLLLTGTPVVNSVEDLYNIIIRIAPKALVDMTRQEFVIHYSEHVEFTPWGLKSHGVKNEKELRARLADCMLSRQVIEGLPELIEKHIRLKLEGRELAMFIKQEQEFLQSHGITENDIIDLQKMSKTDASRFAELRQAVAMFKLPLIVPAIIDQFETGARPIVYVWHKKILAELVGLLRQKCPVGTRIVNISGQVANKHRFELVKDYQAGKIDILVATIGALKEGVNLTEGQIVNFVELPYTPAEIDQCIGRLHRTGQKNPVMANSFYFSGGIDAHIVRLLKNKQTIIDKVIR